MRASRVAALASVGVALAGCGTAVATHRANASSAPACAATVDATLGQVAQRIYRQAVAGGNVADAQRRLARSSALAAAVARGSRSKTMAALNPLLKSQIHRIVITRDGRTLASVGSAPAVAPVHGVIVDAGRTVGRYTMSVAGRASILDIIRGLTGQRVVVTSAGTSRPPGATASFAATVFPSGTRRIWLVSSTPGATACAASTQATVAQTLGAVGERLYGTEVSGPATRRVLRYVARDAGVLHAVAADDPTALRAAIVRLFGVHSLHVVRIRATTASGRLVNDVGGPYVLAPASTPLREGGRVIGRMTLSIQDDAGYIKLMRRFTGAEVILRTATGVVPGSYVGPATQAFTFRGASFPAGALAISIVPPASTG